MLDETTDITKLDGCTLAVVPASVTTAGASPSINGAACRYEVYLLITSAFFLSLTGINKLGLST